MLGILRTYVVNTFPILRRLFSNKMVRYFPNPNLDLPQIIPDDEVSKHTAEIKKIMNEHLNSILESFPPSSQYVDGGLYVGVTGISYMFYRLAKNPELSGYRSLYLEKALQYLKPALETTAGAKTSFLLGDAGTYALAAVLKKELNEGQFMEHVNDYKSLYHQYLNLHFLRSEGDELFEGRTGYLAGALWMTRELQLQVFENEELFKICDVLITSGRVTSKANKSPCPLMFEYYHSQYIGAAHGASSILQMLLSVPGYLEWNKSAAQDIKATIEYLASIQDADGNWPACMEELGLSEEHQLIHWCHGAPGTVYLMAKAYLIFKDELYLNACVRAANVVWKKGLLRKGPGICHGIAGNGYVFLLLFRLTGNQRYMYKANCFAEFMRKEEFMHEASQPDNPLSLYEGIGGTIIYLADILYPEKAEFPFQDVFSTYTLNI